jgi:hypothetical protein
MSKHSSAEDKLHVSKEVRLKNTRPPSSQQNLVDKAAPIGLPPKGTNANNQYR